MCATEDKAIIHDASSASEFCSSSSSNEPVDRREELETDETAEETVNVKAPFVND